ncbi:MAG: S8 family serine peptidase [Deltaproteobacteria bacterium]|nr:S8 family serine peptidase [Deltaproteobacteria bacterium]
MTGMKMWTAIFAAVAMMWAGGALADDTIRLRSRTFTPEATRDIATDLRANAGARIVVQLPETPNEAARDAYRAAGIHLLRPLSGTAWLARIEPRDFTAKSAPAVRWVGRLAADDKLHENVRAGVFGPWSVAENSRCVMYVGMFPDVSEAEGRALLAAYGRPIEHTTATNGWLVAIDPVRVRELASRDEVVWIEQSLPALEPNMDVAKPAVGGDVANEDYGVKGAGIKVLILDGGTVYNGFHQDLAGRITVIGFPIPDILVGHATNVMGIVGGNGTVSGGQYVGIAPEASFISASVLPLSIPPLYNSPRSIESQYRTAVQDHGANVSNNSIGANLARFGTALCNMEGDYEGTAQLIDALVYGKYGPITIVWANGNERGYGACGSTYSTTPPPAPAKNTIAVGAVNKDSLVMTSFSSYGPTDDGRLRPDVSAPGCATDGGSFTEGITACGPGDNYISMCGTSQASPVVAGAAALVHEYWALKNGGAQPWTSTVKGLIIHGSLDEDTPGPNYRYGYGVLQIPPSLDLIDEANVRQDAIDQGDELTLDFEATGGEVKATLVWTDPPGPTMTAKALVNDLDLSIEAGDADWLPWVLDPASPADDATRGENHRDPVEQVLVDEAADGELVTVVVRASEVPMGPQSFTLIVSGVRESDSSDDDADDDAGDDDMADDDMSDDDAAADDDDDDDDDDGCGC